MYLTKKNFKGQMTLFTLTLPVKKKRRFDTIIYNYY